MSDGGNLLYYKGRIKGYNPSAGLIQAFFTFSETDPNPVLISQFSSSNNVYPNSNGEFTFSRNKPTNDFYYRLVIIRASNELYLSPVNRSSFPKLMLNLISIEQVNEKVRIKANIPGVTGSGFVSLFSIPGRFKDFSFSNTSGMLSHNNGIIDTLLDWPGVTIVNSSNRIYASDLKSKTDGYSNTFQTVIRESFETNKFSQVANWSVGSFTRQSVKANSGNFSLGSSVFFGTSNGTFRSCTLTVDPGTSAKSISFFLAADNLNPIDKVELYVNDVLSQTLQPGAAFTKYTAPIISSYTNRIEFRLTKFDQSSSAGKIFIDDVKIEY